MKPIDAVRNWMDNQPDEAYITGNKWDGHVTYWVQCTREDEQDRYSYNFGYETQKGKWRNLITERNLDRNQLEKCLKRFKTEYNF